jgi:GNAT superfamily N-acetyltransferase
MNDTGARTAREGFVEASASNVVRRATQSDAAALARLRLEFRGPRAPNVESETEFLARCETWMRERLRDDSIWRVWLLARNNDPIGAVWLQVVEKLPNPTAESELHAYVSNFYVRPDHRNSGGGSLLLRAALDEAKRLGVDAIFLWPSARSRSLYERHGFAVSDDVLVHSAGADRRR